MTTLGEITENNKERAKNMLCPNCGIGIKPKFSKPVTYVNSYSDEEDLDELAYEISGTFCPECDQFIARLRTGDYFDSGGEWYLSEADEEKVIYPNRKSTRIILIEIPDTYKNDFLEADSILELSPKASAAINRRILQHILKDEYNINKFNLAEQISDFIKLPDVPGYLSKSIDAVRNIGNFAAHPLKSTQSGEVLDVEPGEAEWCLDVLEDLFDFTFVQPQKQKERIDRLNSKLKELGKPTIKE